ncbi:MAG: hypothetical protein K2O66_06920 [Bacteroidales bacterium]|nr:hypothetical protein [Bacteroidales bacterium]MDE7073073.1 hypothetical protein [Bacteroidales bacterium]
MNLKRSTVLAITALCSVVLLATSCKTPREKRLEAENEKLQNDIVKSDSVQIQFMNAYAEIDANLQAIKTREKMINKNSRDAETNPDIQQRIIGDIVEIGKLMENNRKKLQDMESLRRQLVSARSANEKLKAENTSLKEKPKMNAEDAEKLAYYEKENRRLAEVNKGLEQTIARLKQQLAESEAAVNNLREELTQLKRAYAVLQSTIDSLNYKSQQYLADLEEKENTIASLNEQINSSKAVYFIAAPSKELKSKQIVAKGGINANASIKNFTQTNEDQRIIETKSGKINLLTSHPNGSYRIDNKDKKNIKLEITNPKAFWSLSKVCVIETK